MVMITIPEFEGGIPKMANRLLPDTRAQSTTNSRLETGKMEALRKAVQAGITHFNPPKSIYKERETGSWLDWQTDVDVIRSPLDTTPATLIYTGDGKPKIKAVGSSTIYDLGVPAPADAPSVVASSDSQGGDISSIQRIVLGTYVSSNQEDKNVYGQTGAGLKTMTFAVTQDQVVNIHVQIKMTYVQADTGATVLPVGVLVFRDPLNVSAIYAAAKAGTTLPEQPIEARTYNIQFGNTAGPVNANVDLVGNIDDFFLDTPSAATHTYLVIWRSEDYHQYADFRPSLSPPIAQIYGYRLNWNLEARVNNRMRIVSVQDTNLIVGASVQFSDIVGTGALPAGLNTKVFNVSDIINSKTFNIATLVEGTYTSGGTWKQFFSVSTLESRAYRYTYVSTINGVDYEGPGSEASEIVDAGDGQLVTVNGFDPFPGSWNSPVSKIRIYRFAASSSTTGAYQFVGEIPYGTSSFNDTISDADLGESLPSPDREPPIATLSGLIELPNGGAAAFSGKTIWLAEPNFLHAWPAEYARNCHDDIVAIGAFGSSIAIATKSQPYILTGTDPANMTMDKIEMSQPCLSKDGCVDFGYSWVYPAPDGLMMLSPGSAKLVTEDLFTEAQWLDLNPSSFKAARYENKYVCFYQQEDGTKGGFMFDPRDPGKGVILLDFWADSVWTDISDGRFYYNRNNLIKKLDADDVEMDARWRSKDFATPEICLSCAKVEAAKYPVYLSAFVNGKESFSIPVYSKNGFRLPERKGTLWSFEIRSQHRVDLLLVAENMKELGTYQGGN